MVQKEDFKKAVAQSPNALAVDILYQDRAEYVRYSGKDFDKIRFPVRKAVLIFPTGSRGVKHLGDGDFAPRDRKKIRPATQLILIAAQVQKLEDRVAGLSTQQEMDLWDAGYEWYSRAKHGDVDVDNAWLEAMKKDTRIPREVAQKGEAAKDFWPMYKEFSDGWKARKENETEGP